LFVHEGLVAMDLGEGIFGLGGVAFLACAVALAFGLMNQAEDGFARFFGRFGQAFGIAADAGAIAVPMLEIICFAVFSFDEAGAIPGGVVAFGVPVGIRAIFGVAFAADAAAGGDVDVSCGRWKRMGTNGHESRFSFGFGVMSFWFG